MSRQDEDRPPLPDARVEEVLAEVRDELRSRPAEDPPNDRPPA